MPRQPRHEYAADLPRGLLAGTANGYRLSHGDAMASAPHRTPQGVGKVRECRFMGL